jgi:hypothetical protein
MGGRLHQPALRLTFYGRKVPVRIRPSMVTSVGTGGINATHLINHKESGAFLFTVGSESQIVLILNTPCSPYEIPSHYLDSTYHGGPAWPLQSTHLRLTDEPVERMCKRCATLLAQSNQSSTREN